MPPQAFLKFAVKMSCFQKWRYVTDLTDTQFAFPWREHRNYLKIISTVVQLTASWGLRGARTFNERRISVMDVERTCSALL